MTASSAELGASSGSDAPLRSLSQAPPNQARSLTTRPLTHVQPSDDFDLTLKLPALRDSVEARRARLATRYKAACSTYKVLTGVELGTNERKELVELFAGYEGKLRATAAGQPGDAKRDADALHDQLTAAQLDELERMLAKIEDRLLALDDCLLDDEFKALINRSKLPPKALVRYARVLATRRFNIGYRRDRFEQIALDLLTYEGPDRRLRLMPRDKAATVLTHLLAGLPQTAAAEERGPASAHLREALDRLAKITSAREFFESEFFLDLHGYKISMRDQIVCPEFLYLCAALHVEISNRLLAFSQGGGGSLAALQAQLQEQKLAAEEVFGTFRRPRNTPHPSKPSSSKPLSPQPSAADAPAAAGAPAAGAGQSPELRARRKRKQRQAQPAPSAALPRLKLAALLLVIVVAAASALTSAGVVVWGTPAERISEAKLRELSPLLLRGAIHEDHARRFEGLVSPVAWHKLGLSERRSLATDLAAKLKAIGVPNARVLAYRTPVIVIEYATVVSVDEELAQRTE